jgi:hypothetical protein
MPCPTIKIQNTSACAKWYKFQTTNIQNIKIHVMWLRICCTFGKTVYDSWCESDTELLKVWASHSHVAEDSIFWDVTLCCFIHWVSVIFQKTLIMWHKRNLLPVQQGDHVYSNTISFALTPVSVCRPLRYCISLSSSLATPGRPFLQSF